MPDQGRFDRDTPDEPFDLADCTERRYGLPGDPEADERLRADLAAVREAERAAMCRHPDHIGLESCLHRHAHG